jgi:hypothetical protein
MTANLLIILQCILLTVAAALVVYIIVLSVYTEVWPRLVVKRLHKKLKGG